MADIDLTLGLTRPNVELASVTAEAASEDARLVRAISDGDEAAFASFHRKYAPLVHGVLLARMPADEVDDVVQEVFLAAFRGIRNLRDPDALGPWLVKLTRNHVAGFYRSRKPADELPEEIVDSRQGRNDAADVLHAIRSLP